MTEKRQKRGQTYVVFGFLAVFLIISVFPIVPPATALTLQDVQARIQSLSRQIQALQAQIQAFSERERRLALLPSQSLPRLN